jgi:hypothetical protein
LGPVIQCGGKANPTLNTKKGERKENERKKREERGKKEKEKSKEMGKAS